jgi:predicted short-subunit dehydrogenase-like oxidoreductase (DUF2520 family)
LQVSDSEAGELNGMFESVRIVGRGRLGRAVAARLAGQVRTIDGSDPDLVLLCVPDDAIRAVAADLAPGPWVAHLSGATPLSAMAPHVRRFGVHPLQTFNRSGDPAQFDGAWGAVTAGDEEARVRGFWLAGALGLRAFEISDDLRAVYHAGAAIAANYLVTLHRAASRLFAEAAAPPEALEPLMRRTIENGFDLTGPLARGDRTTIDRHLAAIRAHAPELERMYLALAETTAP